jgi:hypothetical protein
VDPTTIYQLQNLMLAAMLGLGGGRVSEADVAERVSTLANMPPLHRWAATRAVFRPIVETSPRLGSATWVPSGTKPQLPAQLVLPGWPETNTWPEQRPARIQLNTRYLAENPEAFAPVVGHELGHLLGFMDAYKPEPSIHEFNRLTTAFTQHPQLTALLKQAPPLDSRSLALLRAQVSAGVADLLAKQLVEEALGSELDMPGRLSLAYQGYGLRPLAVAWHNRLRPWLIRNQRRPVFRAFDFELGPTARHVDSVIEAVRSSASPAELAQVLGGDTGAFSRGQLARLSRFPEVPVAAEAARTASWLWNVGQFARLAGEVVPSVVAPIAAGALAHQIYKHFIRPRLVSEPEQTA